jgi:DnaJ-class molecular chaperone
MCEECWGHGFLRSGDFANRSFPRCTKCGGIGQIYLEEPPPPPPEKK